MLNVGRGILDTSVLIAFEAVNSHDLPAEIAISAVSLAELTAGPHATKDLLERARRQDNLQRIEAAFAALPFEAEAARAYGRVYAAMLAGGRKPRGRRALDLMIAATALAAGVPLFTCNAADFAGLGKLLDVRSISV